MALDGRQLVADDDTNEIGQSRSTGQIVRRGRNATKYATKYICAPQ